MESFLDRLLAQERAPRAARPRPPWRPGATAPAAASGTSRRRPRRRSAARSRRATAPRSDRAPRASPSTTRSPARRASSSVEERDVPGLIASLAEKTYHSCREQGGNVPFTVINELIENLIHASFCDVVITILDGGRVVRISDHGPACRRQGPGLPAGLHHGDGRPAALHPGSRFRTAHRPRVAGLPARRHHRRRQPRRRRGGHHQDAAAGRPSSASRRAGAAAAPSSRPVRRRSSCCSWS